MHIAVLGATSQIARDFVQACNASSEHRFSLYARRPEVVQAWATQKQLRSIARIASFDSFTNAPRFDAVLHCVGVGNPAAAQSLGAGILDITYEYDTLALRHIQSHPDTRYIFLSSGAAYGANFTQPANENTPCQFGINHMQAQDWYGAAKFHAECRHRALSDLPIVDIRVFSYFSHSQDLNARFLISDILRAIQSKQVLKTSTENIVRDYIGPAEFAMLVNAVLQAPPMNIAVDAFSAAPIDKMTLLTALEKSHGLRWEVDTTTSAINATGMKMHYYSKHQRPALELDYTPERDSMQVILEESLSSGLLSSYRPDGSSLT